MDATLRFIVGASKLPGINLTVISQDPADRMPAAIRHRLAGHWRVDDALDPDQIVYAANRLASEFGVPARLLGPLEQLQVPLAVARSKLGVDGLGVDAALNFRDKSRNSMPPRTSWTAPGRSPHTPVFRLSSSRRPGQAARVRFASTLPAILTGSSSGFRRTRRTRRCTKSSCKAPSILSTAS